MSGSSHLCRTEWVPLVDCEGDPLQQCEQLRGIGDNRIPMGSTEAFGLLS